MSRARSRFTNTLWTDAIADLRESISTPGGSNVDAWRLLECAKVAARGGRVPGYSGPDGLDELHDHITAYLRDPHAAA